MPRIALLFGGLLVLLGIIGYAATDGVSVTALIPTAFGLLLILTGLLGGREALRPHAMHAAALLALVGFAGTASAPVQLLDMFSEAPTEGSEAVPYKSAMAVLTLVFLLLCTRSFIAARRSRNQTQASSADSGQPDL